MHDQMTPLQSHTFYTKYARYREDLGRRETYEEAVDRVIDMHRTKYAGIPNIDAYLAEVEYAMKQQRILGSQRALQFGGAPILKKNARIYNCSASYCDRLRFFQEAFWLLLCGCGVGFSVQRHHTAKLPKLRAPDPNNYFAYAVPDTIEGWADALGMLLSSYVDESDAVFPEAAGRTVVFDMSQIRPAGASISSGIGKAPGPEPLRRSLELIRAVVDRAARTYGRLRPIDAYDIVMHASDAVLSGGVRRSATICIFSPDDTEMAAAKTGNWFIENPQRARSNNSALLLRHAVSEQEFKSLMSYVKEFGEPGFVWADSTEIVFNPCVEVALYPVDVETGKTGWQFCNLTEINMKACRTLEDYKMAARAASILGTLQAGYTSLEYLGEISERITKREALLGVSMTGMMENPSLAFDAEAQREAAKIAVETNAEVARVIRINRAARVTCVKPSGTASCLLNTSSGVHPHHARRYFRRVQTNHRDAYVDWYKAKVPEAVEPSKWNPNGTDVVLTFCIEVADNAKIKADVPAIKLLQYVKLTQQNWVAAGHVTKACVQPYLKHNVSNTITVENHEWDAVADYIYKNREFFTGVSLLPATGDVDYPQAPFSAVYTRDELHERYGESLASAAYDLAQQLHNAGVDPWNIEALRQYQPYQQFIEQFQNDPKALHCLKYAYYSILWNIIWPKQMQAGPYCPAAENHANASSATMMLEAACSGGACVASL